MTIEQIAKDFRVLLMTQQKLLRRADTDDRTKPGRSRTEGVELREARKRIRLLEKENEVLRGRRICRRRTCQEEALPARERARRRRVPLR